MRRPIVTSPVSQGLPCDASPNDLATMVRSVSEPEVESHQQLIERLESAWERSDALFELVRESSIRERPSELRHPVIFYLGHVSASAWSHYGRPTLERESPRPEFDGLFEEDRADESLAPGDWPPVNEIRGYCDGIRKAFRSGARDLVRVPGPSSPGGKVLRSVLEHELAYHETLLNLFQELDLGYKRRPHWWSAPERGSARVEARFVELQGEHGRFELASTPVTIAEFERFVDDGGYEEASLWDPAERGRVEDCAQDLPRDWMVRNGRRYVRTMFDRIPLDEVGGWPVGTSPAEARAYARWKGARLPSSGELAAAARELLADRPDGGAAARGNLGFRHGSPTPVGTFPEGATREGIHDLLGNGWDLTDGGAPTALFGGSWATDAALAARVRLADGESPLPFTQFRLARDPR